jgi:hypothetical protein
VALVEEGIVGAIITLARTENDEIKQDCARCLANLCSNEENHPTVYCQGALDTLISLTRGTDDVTRKYAALALRFMATNPEVRCMLVSDNRVEPFILLSKEDYLDFKRTAAVAFASFSLNEENRPKLVRSGALRQVMLNADVDDLEVRRDTAFALANVCDSLDLQMDVVREGGIETLTAMGQLDDARIQRDVARGLACLSVTEDIKGLMVGSTSTLQTLFKLSRSLDVACQRYATLTLCNLSTSDLKKDMVDQGAIRPLMFLARFPDLEVQRTASLALGGLALGTPENKVGDPTWMPCHVVPESARPMAAKYASSD